MPPTFLSQYPLSEAGTQSVMILNRLFVFHPCVCVIVLLILLPDIPLSCLEERKSERIRLLKERIGQLKQQMSGDCQPAGNVKTPFGARTCCLK